MKIFLLLVIASKLVAATFFDEISCNYKVDLTRSVAISTIHVPARTEIAEYPAILLDNLRSEDNILLPHLLYFNDTHKIWLLGFSGFFSEGRKNSLNLTLEKSSYKQKLISPVKYLTSNEPLQPGEIVSVGGLADVESGDSKEVCDPEDYDFANFGCDDSEHLKVNDAGIVLAGLDIRAGTTLEVAIAYIVDNANFHDSEPLAKILWEVTDCCTILSRGIIMSLADTSDDLSIVNAEYQWRWIANSKNKALIEIKATKDILQGNPIYLPSEGGQNNRKVCNTNFAAILDKKKSFEESSCKYILHEAFFGEEKEIRVVSNEVLLADQIIFHAPTATIETNTIAKTALDDYVFGFNSSHSLLTFGIAMMLSHSEYSNTRHTFTHKPFLFGQLDSPDVAFKTTQDVQKDEEFFTSYGGENWFKSRGMEYFPQVKSASVPDAEHSQGRFPGCSDSSHLIVRGRTVRSSFLIKKGTVIETTRVLFVPRKQIINQEARSLFWEIDTDVAMLFLGLSLTFARATSDQNITNAAYKWHTIEAAHDRGIVSVISTREIRAFEEIVLPCLKGSQLKGVVHGFSRSYQENLIKKKEFPRGHDDGDYT